MNTEAFKSTTPLQFYLNDNDINEISNALSFIWTKMQYRLKNIAITDNMGTVLYGKRTQRLTINLKKSTHILAKQVNIKLFQIIYLIL